MLTHRGFFFAIPTDAGQGIADGVRQSLEYPHSPNGQEGVGNGFTGNEGPLV